MNRVPTIAILAPNQLMGLGLQSILTEMFPFALFEVCRDFDTIAAHSPEELFHIFAWGEFVTANRTYFEAHRNKVIVVTEGESDEFEEFMSLNAAAAPEQIRMSLTKMHGSVHGAANAPKDILSPREIEVLRLIVEGKLNKEIAAELNISLSTVITHRKNIVEKVGVKSAAGLTIYAIMKRYITIPM